MRKEFKIFLKKPGLIWLDTPIHSIMWGKIFRWILTSKNILKNSCIRHSVLTTTLSDNSWQLTSWHSGWEKGEERTSHYLLPYIDQWTGMTRSTEQMNHLYIYSLCMHREWNKRWVCMQREWNKRWVWMQREWNKRRVSYLQNVCACAVWYSLGHGIPCYIYHNNTSFLWYAAVPCDI